LLNGKLTHHRHHPFTSARAKTLRRRTDKSASTKAATALTNPMTAQSLSGGHWRRRPDREATDAEGGWVGLRASGSSYSPRLPSAEERQWRVASPQVEVGDAQRLSSPVTAARQRRTFTGLPATHPHQSVTTRCCAGWLCQPRHLALAIIANLARPSIGHLADFPATLRRYRGRL
jgi:hypothetical protein